MGNYYLDDKIKRLLQERKYKAETIAQINTHAALKNEEYLALENKIGGLIIEVAKANMEGNDPYEFEKQIIECKLEQDIILNKLNLKRSDLTPNYECTICNDTGFDANGNKCICAKNLTNALLKNQCGMPLNSEITFKQCEDVDKKILDLIKNICINYPEKKTYTNLLLAGDTGVGKTYLTQAMANSFIQKELLTIFTTATNLVNDFLKYHTTFNEEKLGYFEPYIECDVLIIDDLGTESILKNITKEYLLNLINERKLKERFTIITTNLTNDGILERYGERIFSRLFDQLKCICIQFGNKDLRLKKEKK